MAYAKQLTRDYLEYLGITKVTEDGHVFKGDRELKQKYDGRYLLIGFYDPALRRLVPFEERTTASGEFSISVQRIMYAWFYRIVPDGMVIDHIDNNKTNNILSNLQLYTPKENVTKMKDKSERLVKCNLEKDRQFYEDKIAEYTKLYEDAKVGGNAKAAHT